MKKTVKNVPLILLGDSNAEILNLEVGLLILFFQENSNDPLVRGVLDGILKEPYHRFFENLWISEQGKIVGPV